MERSVAKAEFTSQKSESRNQNGGRQSFVACCHLQWTTDNEPRTFLARPSLFRFQKQELETPNTELSNYFSVLPASQASRNRCSSAVAPGFSSTRYAGVCVSPRSNFTFRVWPPRRRVNSTRVPGFRPRTRGGKFNGRPSISTSTSPGRSPAFAAFEFGSTDSTVTSPPCARAVSKPSAASATEDRTSPRPA